MNRALKICGMAVMMIVGAMMSKAETITLTGDWKVQSSAKISSPGSILSTPAAQTEGWIPATVPSTLMGVLTANGIEPEALTAADYQRIDRKQFETSWWYRTTFSLPSLKKGEHVILSFDGICYRANVWLNGRQIANSQDLAGTFRQFELDITKHIRPTNVLAVEVFRAQKGEPSIGFADWNPRPADENMGIFREVRVKTCGAVSVAHTAVRSRVNAETLDEAWLTVATELTNHSNKAVTGMIKGTVEGEVFSYRCTVPARQTRSITLPTEILVKHPRLWWCHNMGKPELCDLHLEFVGSDSEDIRFGIREIHSYLTEEGYRGFTLNGRKVLIRGAGWTDDLYLRDTPATNRQQLEYVRDMNMNTVRLEGFWGTSHDLYDICDELGLMILVGWSCHWEWEDYIGIPCDERFGGILSAENIDLVARSFEDQVMWLRRHPSIIGWFVGSDMLPKPELERQYLSFLKENDDRDYLISAKDQTSEISGPSGTKMAGPYEYVDPAYWYLPDAPGGAFGFNTETGIGAQLPVRESLEKMLGSQLFPIDERWNILCTASASEMNSLRKLNEVIHHRFGDAADISQYLYRADMLNYESTRAMFESFRVRWPHTTGIIQWMLNSARPGIYWQLYDYYLQPNAAYYAVKKANAPVQLIYDYHRKAVYAVNETLETTGCKASMMLMKGETLTQDTKRVEVAPGSVAKVFDIDTTGAPAAFLFLKLSGNDGTEITTNEYFLPAGADTYDWPKSTWVNTPITQYASYAMLDDMVTRSCQVSVRKDVCGSSPLYKVTVSNPSRKVAFMIRLTAKDRSGQLLCPAYWSDNYLTLAPGETRTVTCYLPSLSKEDDTVIISPAQDNRMVVGAYVTAGSDIVPDVNVMTHLNYAFGGVNQTFNGVNISRPERLKMIVGLKQQNPELKVLLSIGGWTSGRFSEMAATQENREAFAKDCRRIVDEFGLDGIDMDWEYPTSSEAGISSSPDDTENFTLLMKELRRQLGQERLLTMATVCTAKYIDFKNCMPYVDLVNVMAYDMSDPLTAHHAALYPSPISGYCTSSEAVEAHLKAGVPREKLVMGIPFYGKGDGKDPNVKDYLKTGILPKGYQDCWSDEAQVPYILNKKGKYVWGYENIRSLTAKCKYITDNGLRGGMYWEYSIDNAQGDHRNTIYQNIASPSAISR